MSFHPKLYSRLFALLVALVCCPAFAWGQQPPVQPQGPSGGTFDITGFVKSEVDDQPVQGARMELMSESNNVVHPPVLSSSTGEFRFAGFPAGDYFILVDKSGYESARVRVTISTHGNQVMLRIRPLPSSRAVPVVASPVILRNAAIPEKALDAFEKGLTLLTSRSDYRGAIGQFERATKIFPGYYEAFAQMGVAYDRLGDAATAEKEFRKSLEISSGKYSESFFLLAEMLNDHNRFADAEKIARQATEREANSPRGHYELSRALAGLKRDNEAEASAVKARELKPDSAAVHLLLANIHKRLHNYQDLLRDLDAYLELAPAGPASDQARALRDQVQRALETQSKQPAAPQS